MTGNCFLCGKWAALETHHLFGGGLRKKSDRMGLTVHLCHACHNEPPYGVHHNALVMQRLHQYGQRKAMQEHGWTVAEFTRAFYKNYLEEW